MKRLLIILGNGFTIDFINKISKNDKVDVKNLFRFGHAVNLPFDKRPGFLSYKNCPNLWTLGARPNKEDEESQALIEEILTCTNMFFDFINEADQKSKRLSLEEPENQSIYIRAYSELVVYLKNLFTYYDTCISNDEIDKFVNSSEIRWGWKDLFKNLVVDNYERITFVTYNYDIWLERILNILGIEYEICGLESKPEVKVNIIKPHGSINFIPKTDSGDKFKINYRMNFDGIEISQLKLESDFINYTRSAIIPPAGDSSRMQTSSWASKLRLDAKNEVKKITDSDEVIICGMSYWHVDRKELDEILINLNQNANITFINPNPSKDLNAVLVSLFENYVLLTSSDALGGILND
ncbi:MAG TPA: hypothetical protein VHT96_07060 [Clostridia bacterium]|nr:hypothetical protein [Clostridia bacterium]